MTREETTNACLQAIDKSKCLMALLSTGVGKTKIAIECINKICEKVYRNESDYTTVLIVVDKKVHITTWKAEFEKWGGVKTDKVEFCCYASIHKYAGKHYDCVVLDECHHIGSEIRMEALEKIHIDYNLICLSATVNKELRKWFRHLYSTTIVECVTQEAIDAGILPDPVIYLMPLTLDKTRATEILELQKGSKDTPIVDTYQNLWVHKRSRRHALIKCTQWQYNKEMDGLVAFYKSKVYNGNAKLKSLWLRACTDRLRFLANAKNAQVKAILQHLKNYRTITFCASIEQTEVLGKNCIHSKNKLAHDTLRIFNEGKAKHITACHMLNEGVNLSNCKYGIFANINASETIQVQRVGRSLRHKEPVLIIPFFRDTREEEIVRKWMENYNRELIKIIYKPEEVV